ncbi:hypothetical protein CVT26_002718 [Gymnopilus dilepis]|uniref:Uncharacterized protein n=1 Tax=Gymnopilus dilepis TaxID=231916 RepID=A0A409Y3B8_9AGAR|nr:hypothetical protein CVT26_002718 [Gymnopilus dilepis]
MPKAPFPSFSLALSGSQLAEETPGAPSQERGVEVDLMGEASDEDKSDTETIFEVRDETNKSGRDKDNSEPIHGSRAAMKVEIDSGSLGRGGKKTSTRLLTTRLTHHFSLLVLFLATVPLPQFAAVEDLRTVPPADLLHCVSAQWGNGAVTKRFHFGRTRARPMEN